MRCRAPYKPLIRYPTDTSNFDEVEEDHSSAAPAYQTDDLRQNGLYPEHAFSEFTFRRFFDSDAALGAAALVPGGKPFNISESLSSLLSISTNNNSASSTTGVSNGSTSSNATANTAANQRNQSESDRTPQNSYHDDETTANSVSQAASAGGNSTTSGNPVYV